jgi:hypothetical protein
MLHRFGPLLATALVTASACAQYCAVGRATDTCPGGEFISDLVYDDGYGFVDAWNGPCVASGYEDLTGTFGFSVYTDANPLFSVVVANAHPSDKVTFWLDADLDGAFGANEAIASNKVGGAYYFAAPPIPACWPYSGPTTMRVALSRASSGPQPACGTHAFGDWKDVTVYIGTNTGLSPACPIPLSLGTTVFGVDEHGITPTPCGGGWSSDVWFSFTPTTSGTYVFSASDAQDWITGVFIYAGGVLTPQICIAGNYGSGPLVAGQTYVLSVGNYYSFAFYLTISLTVSLISAPANDECSAPIPLGVGLSPIYSNAAATNSAVPPSPCPFQRDVWFSFAPPADDYYAVATANVSPGNSALEIYDSCGGQRLACDWGSSIFGGATAEVVVPLASSNTYLIRVGDASSTPLSGASVNFSIDITPTPGPTLAFSVQPGQLGFSVAHGLSGGDYFVAMTLNPGAFPNGSFWGIDATPDELVAQFLVGAPFRANLNGLGAVSQGPFAGLPPGLTIYAVLLTDIFGTNFLAGTPTSVTTI